MLPLRISVLDGDVLSFYVAKLAQSQPNCLGTGGVTSWIGPPIDTLSEGLSSAAAPRLSLQEQATPLQQGLMAPQPSSLRTSFRALCITRIEIKESVIYTAEGDSGFVNQKARASRNIVG